MADNIKKVFPLAIKEAEKRFVLDGQRRQIRIEDGRYVIRKASKK